MQSLVSRCFTFIIIICFFVGTTGSIRMDIHINTPLLQKMADSGMSPLQAHEILMKRKTMIPTDSIYVPLFKSLDSDIYGNLLIGHPGQTFKVAFDTAWADTWVPSILCPVQYIACNVHNRYNSRKSSTYVIDDRQIVINDSSQYYAGKFSIDLFHFGKVNITNQTFIEMTVIPFINSFYANDGVLGVGLNSLAHGGTTVLSNLVTQKKISKKLFSLYLNKDPRTKKGGTLLFGGIDSDHYSGNITFIDVASSTYWALYVKSLMVKGRPSNDYCKQQCFTIIDTSSTSIKGPDSSIDRLSLDLNSSAFLFGRYMVPCSMITSLPSLTFRIGDRDFTLKGKDYVQVITWEGFQLCLTAFEKSNLGPGFPNNTWILGGAFLSRYYSVFDADNKKIGLADVRL